MARGKQCDGCGDGAKLSFDFTMAFQPIVDFDTRSVWGYEALVRGIDGQGAGAVLAKVNDQNRYRFDQACRVRAIDLAGQLFARHPYRLSINFMPNAVYEPAACIRTSLQAADRAGLTRGQLMFEFTENERMDDVTHVKHIINEYKRFGFITALDDFGSGYAGLGLLASFQPSLIKLDMLLIRDIDTDPIRQAIVAGMVAMARQIGILVLAEGIETAHEAAALRRSGISLMQGFYFARPQIETLPKVEETCFDGVGATVLAA